MASSSSSSVVNLWASPSEQNKKDVLVEFRAGTMNFNTTTQMVDSDKRKGLVQLKQSAEDNLIHFVWKDRTTGTEVMNLIIFPGDATFRRVEEARPGRVYVLEWKMTDKKCFFWIQEPKDDKDKEYCDNVNKFINDPPQPSQNQSAGGLGALGGLGGALGGIDPAQLRQLLQAGGFGGMDPTQLMQLLSQGGEGLGGFGAGRRGAGRGGAQPQRQVPVPTPSTTAMAPTAAPQPSINRGTLQNILDGLMTQPQQQSGPPVPSPSPAPAPAPAPVPEKKSDKPESKEKTENEKEKEKKDKDEDKNPQQ